MGNGIYAAIWSVSFITGSAAYKNNSVETKVSAVNVDGS